ncbi:type IV pilus biogenesis/stability protein PilW [Rodentibacter haemolyticus]|uniref:Type IV pilus biogenesis/stability protein PilW n=1 Tax=Rodentibacter haemolyticus TaxID=2778911 RepID=A0ABX6UY78_9PAST|nr:type IV pilus biogenesis/stability protein PilW [Rodentibacter haemolyticus]QPB42999.1 type IV pilus biogenesis/stability protein PilW [Rodentibacter haemolyticus]
MKPFFIQYLSAVIFPLIFSACVSQTSSSDDFNKQQAAKARVELALGYLHHNNFPQAKQNLDKALEHDKNYSLVHSAFAHFYQLQGDVISARESYLQAIKLNDKQGETYNNFGAFLCGQGEFEQARQAFEQALSSPRYYHQADTYENLALCARAFNQKDIYQQAVDKLRQIDEYRAEKLNQIK